VPVQPEALTQAPFDSIPLGGIPEFFLHHESQSVMGQPVHSVVDGEVGCPPSLSLLPDPGELTGFSESMSLGKWKGLLTVVRGGSLAHHGTRCLFVQSFEDGGRLRRTVAFCRERAAS